MYAHTCAQCAQICAQICAQSDRHVNGDFHPMVRVDLNQSCCLNSGAPIFPAILYSDTLCVSIVTRDKRTSGASMLTLQPLASTEHQARKPLSANNAVAP